MYERQLTLGSLFDGSGGFPLAGLLNGIRPVWASEVAPFPILVTAKRLPEVKHYGDISTLNGAELEPVDIITFGSPCTDHGVSLNVAMDLEPFGRINPCGYAGLQTVDLSTIGVHTTWEDAANVLARQLLARLAP